MPDLVSLSPWYDVADTLEGVRGKLRLQIGDIDEERLSASIPAAAASIDAYLDRCELLTGPPPPAAVQQGLERASINVYNDVADPLDGCRALLLPYKQRWGQA